MTVIILESKNQESPEQDVNGGAKNDLTALQNHNLLIALAHGGGSGAASFAMPVSLSRLKWISQCSTWFSLLPCSITISSSFAHRSSLSKAKAAATAKMSVTQATRAAPKTTWIHATCRWTSSQLNSVTHKQVYSASRQWNYQFPCKVKH